MFASSHLSPLAVETLRTTDQQGTPALIHAANYAQAWPQSIVASYLCLLTSVSLSQWETLGLIHITSQRILSSADLDDRIGGYYFTLALAFTVEKAWSRSCWQWCLGLSAEYHCQLRSSLSHCWKCFVSFILVALLGLERRVSASYVCISSADSDDQIGGYYFSGW